MSFSCCGGCWFAGLPKEAQAPNRLGKPVYLAFLYKGGGVLVEWFLNSRRLIG
jgi:hypothetical protein